MEMASCKWHFRLGREEAHYSEDMIAGGYIAKKFGDVATELMVRQDGDGGMLAVLEKIEFKKPLYAGDYVEIIGRVIHVGNTSRRMEFEMYRIGGHRNVGAHGSSGDIDESAPVLIASGSAVGVVSKEKQRKNI